MKCQQLITLTSVTGPFSVSFQNGGTSSWDDVLWEKMMPMTCQIKPIVSAGPCDLIGENIKIDTLSMKTAHVRNGELPSHI